MSETAFSGVPWEALFSEPCPGHLPGPGVIALCKDELPFLPRFIAHHRSIGVQHFVFVDNGSQDQSYEYLRSLDDVTVLRSREPYRATRGNWRRAIADNCFNREWLLFLDPDEWFLYPEMQTLSLSSLTGRLTARGIEAAFSLMVEPYGDRGNYELDDLCSLTTRDAMFFDAEGYRWLEFPEKVRAQWPTPKETVFGGIRDRLFFPENRTPRNLREAAWLSWSALGWKAGRFRVFRPAHRVPLPTPARFSALRATGPNLGKVPLVHWRKGLQMRGAVHQMNSVLATADWLGVILHHQFAGDWIGRAAARAEAGVHADGSSVYWRALGAVSEIEGFVAKPSRRIHSLEAIPDFFNGRVVRPGVQNSESPVQNIF